MTHIPDNVFFQDMFNLLKAAIARVQIANEEGDPILSAWLPDAMETIKKIEDQKAGNDLEACRLLKNWTQNAEKMDLGVKNTTDFLNRMAR